MRATVIVNAAAGLGPGALRRQAEWIATAFAAAGVEAEVRDVPGPELRPAARAAAGTGTVDVVVMGGGDGTMGAGAAALAGTGVPMGVLPLGTHNHFARDLGIPLDLEEAVHVVAAGRARLIDVGEANDHVFVNNASMGLYPVAVHEREARRAGRGTVKWRAMAQASVAVLKRLPVERLTVRMGDGAVPLYTPLLFIGNNRYEMSFFALGRRAALDRGELWLYVARDAGRFGIVRLALRALAGRLDQARDFLAVGLQEVEVDDRRRTLHVALDGELCRLAPPIRCRVRPRALRVMAPPPEGAGAEA